MRTAKRCIPCLRLSSRSNNWGTKRCVGIFVTNQQWNAQSFTQTSCKQEVTREWHVKGHARDPRGFAARSRVVAQLASPPQIFLPFTLAAIFKTFKNFWPTVLLKVFLFKKEEDRNPGSNPDLSYHNLSPLALHNHKDPPKFQTI